MHYLFLALVPVMALISVSLSACHPDTGYYKTLSPGNRELSFTVEYPREWEVTRVQQYSSLVTITILGPLTDERESCVKMDFNVWTRLNSDQDAENILVSRMSQFEKMRNYSLIRYGATSLDGADGYLLEFTHDHPANDLPVSSPNFFYIATRAINITIPRNDRVFEIRISASQNEWDKWEMDIQHVLDTFKWK